ncbi:hypothetical protein RUM44_012267 [Polyplax serrata]|uniref:Uncharacterized protein n=1 Tax=Polyplax serrata TaxID=468196 RepID=A0ABR1BAU6_POLSC
MTTPSASRARAKKAGAKWAHPPPGEEVVISGLSGRFPDSDNVYEFRDKLFDKIDLISDDDRRWKLDHPEIPQRTGKINHLTKFDASFFGFHYKQAHTMDPMGRLLLERAYEAIIDAGVNPRQLKGKKCGVFIGACFSESEKTWFYEKINVNGFGITGCSRTMLANRISYWLGVQGPSYTVDSACSSSLYAMEHAYQSIRDGHCDMAIVGSCNLCLHPYVSLQFFRLGVLSQDGACKSFDNSANGYCRSEAIPMLFLQKAKDAKRIYATIVHCKTNCDGYKEQGITYPSRQMQYELLKEFYEECEINPATVNFIEAHGTGTKVGDPEECNTLDKIFCEGRKGPLLIGSIKSNIGHTEPASGLCSITKAIIAMESGYIPPNLHFKVPREGIPAFVEGRLKVVTEKEPWAGGMIGVNSFGFGGANCHVLLRWNEKEKINGGAPNDDIPRLVVVSGRTEEAVRVMLDELEANPVDVEYIKLYHDLHSQDIHGHNYRGYTILSSAGQKKREIKHFAGKKRDVCFVFSGLGSQWPAMGKTLMKLPIFASAIEKCHSSLVALGLNLKKILTEEDPKLIQNILNSIVATTAVQIGLVDIMYSLGVYPERIVGYSIGDFACGYADGCLTAEQTILCAYYTGLALSDPSIPKGALIALGVGYDNIKLSLPPGVDVAFRNSSASCTVVGLLDVVKKFSSDLNKQGVPVREVSSFNIPIHSRHVAQQRQKILSNLKKVIPISKPRTDKWISSYLPKGDWDFSLAKLCSPEFLSSNVCNPVLFEDVMKQIPKNAIVVELAPEGLLQNFLAASLKETTLSFSLMQRSPSNVFDYLLGAIGKLYEAGCQPQLANLYPTVEYPVSKGTGMISPFVRWEHSQDWYITSYRMQEKLKSGERSVVVNVKDEDFEYLTGHVIDGRTLFPATGYLALVWETVGMMIGQIYTQLAIVFENVRFNRATTLPKEGGVEFTIMVQKSSGKFEIIEGGAPIVTGRAYAMEENENLLNLPEIKPAEGKDLISLNSRDIYKELRLRGYQYKGLFRGLVSLDNLGRTGKITWANNYVAFMDNLLQTQILQEDTRSLYVPTTIRKLYINPSKHQECVQKFTTEEDKTLDVYVYKDMKVIASGGIEIHELRASQIPRKKPLGEPVLERYLFVPHVTTDKSKALSLLETCRLCFHTILENVQTVKVKVVEVGDSSSESVLLANHVASILGDLPLVQAEIIVLAANHPKASELVTGITIEDKKITAEQNCLAVVASNLLEDASLVQQTLKSLKPEGYLIARESPHKELPLNEFNILVDRLVDGERIMLLQSKVATGSLDKEKTQVLKISEIDQFQWIEPLKKHIANAAVKTIILVAEKEKKNGLIGLVNCLRKEPGGLAVNIYKKGEWGSYRHEALPANETVDAAHIYFNSEVRGDLSSLKLYEGPLNVNDCGENVIIYYASINFRDVMLASGKLSIDAAAKGRTNQELPVGLEFSGRLEKSGKRVMGMTRHGALASMLAVKSVILWDIPDDWTLEQAASVPVVYGTVFSAMVTRGRLKRGESVLIHSGTGGVGLAALNVATAYGCNIFTTVGTQAKRDYLKEMYPHIPDSHIGNSRDTSFEDMIKRETNGRGVDVILNSLAEEKLQASLRCLAPDGRFVEIGKFDLSNDNPVGMESFMKCTSFHGVHLDGLFYDHNKKRLNEIRDILDVLIKENVVKPIKTTVFDYSECEQAFRYLTTGKHIGKVLLKLRDEEPVDLCIPAPKLFPSVPRMNCCQSKSYVILGGLGGFGLELADWLVMRGARKLVLTSRNGLKTGYQALRIRLWRTYGVEIVISTADVTTEQGVVDLLTQAEKLGPVDAIFNLAVVLRDAIFENQTDEAFLISFGPKALATKHLDVVSRKLCKNLEHFVIFSSVSCGRGNAGQTNYGMANSVMERICEIRVEEGYPGLAIQWGAIGEVGLVAEMQENHEELVIGGTLQQSISSCLKCMDTFLKQKNAIVASMVVAEKRAGGSGGGNIVDAVVNILGLQDLKTVSLHSSLAELGMDSMMAVEIKQTLEREFDVYLTAQDIRGLTFAKLAQLAAQSKEEGGEGRDSALNQEAEIKRLEHQKLLFGLIGDEETSVKSMLTLKSANMDGTLVEKLKAKHGKVPPIFYIPGLEGVATVLDSVAEKISSPNLGIQFPYNDDSAKSVQDISHKMMQVMKPLLVPSAPFIMVGYSTGALLAIEMASMLEKENYTGHVILIDGAPDLLKMAVLSTFGSAGENEFDASLLHTIYNLFVPGTNMKIKEELLACPTWEDKVAYMEKVIPERVVHSKDHQRRVTYDVRRRLTAVVGYDTSSHKKLKSKVVLVRPAEQFFMANFPDHYNLAGLCENPVDVHFVEGNHLSILQSQKLADIINEIYKNATSLIPPKVANEIDLSIGEQKFVKTR